MPEQLYLFRKKGTIKKQKKTGMRGRPGTTDSSNKQ